MGLQGLVGMLVLEGALAFFADLVIVFHVASVFEDTQMSSVCSDSEGSTDHC